jgi:hypothetical protein
VYKPSRNPRILELTKTIKERNTQLSRIPVIPKDGKRMCLWCELNELWRGNQKYCSKACSQSAMIWANPQKEDALKELLIAQDMKCKTCGYDYRPAMELVRASYKRYSGTSVVSDYDKMPWYYFKRLKRLCEKSRKPEVDHIVPIFKGGESLGLSNHQVLCAQCHKTKTANDVKKVS